MKVLVVIVLISFVVAEPPYQPSGWQPAGDRLRLPVRKLKLQAPVPHSVYGPPSTEATATNSAGSGYQYVPPSNEQIDANPNNEYGPPANQPMNGYGPPQQPEEVGNGNGSPDNGYGPPQQPENGYEEPQDSNNGYQPSQQPDNGYGPPQQPDNGFQAPEQPNNGYGPPQQPANGYGPSQQPDNEYGSPQNPNYEPAPEGSGQLPVDQGASERLRQSQFVQQLPQYESARFRTQQSNRLRQQIRPTNFQNQRLQSPQNFRQPIRQQTNRPQNFAPINQQRPNNFQSQNFRQVTTQQQNTQQRTPSLNGAVSQNVQQKPSQDTVKKFQRISQPSLNIELFESKKISTLPQTPHRLQTQLYTTQTPQLTTFKTRKAKTTTTTTESAISKAEGPNIAVATAVAERYYVLQEDGLLQEVTYKIKDGQVIDGQITPNLKYTDLAPITQPIYQFSGDNRLVRIR